MDTPNFQFGTGVLFARPNAGNRAANPTPSKFGILQEASVTVKGDLKKLFGQKQFPVAKARGKIDVSVKAKYATQDPAMLNQLYFGQTKSAGMNIMAVDEAAICGGSPPAGSVMHAAHFVNDWGVVNALTGAQFENCGTGTPALGQYKVDEDTGIYTFSAADEAALTPVYISYTWFDSTRGVTVELKNQYMGYAPEFSSFLFNEFRGNILGLELYSCTMGTFSIPTKQEDFWISDIDFEASTDSTDTLGKMYAG